MRLVQVIFLLVSLLATTSAGSSFGKKPFATITKSSPISKANVDKAKAKLNQVKKDANGALQKAKDEVDKAKAKADKLKKDANELLKKAKEDAAKLQREAKDKSSPEAVKKAKDKANKVLEDAKKKAESLQAQAKKALTNTK